jgi:hypothetical protein
MIAAQPSFSPVEEIRLYYYLEEHLINFMESYEYQAIFSSCTNPLSVQLRKTCFGYRTFKEFPVSRFIDKNGNRPFQIADINLKTATQVYENKYQL